MVFVSYARRDLPFVRDLCGWLRSKGLDVWLDLTRIEAAQEWSSRIADAITTSSHFVVILSPYAMYSQAVLNEIRLAFQAGRKIIPVLLYETELPDCLAAIQWVDFRVSFERGCEELLARLRDVDTKS